MLFYKAPRPPSLFYVSSTELDMKFTKLTDTLRNYFYHLRVVAADDPSQERVYDCSMENLICYTENLSRMKPYNLSVMALYWTPDDGPGRPPFIVSSEPSPSVTEWTSSESKIFQHAHQVESFSLHINVGGSGSFHTTPLILTFQHLQCLPSWELRTQLY